MQNASMDDEGCCVKRLEAFEMWQYWRYHGHKGYKCRSNSDGGAVQVVKRHKM